MTISVITTTYRRPDYLAEALGSIASQTRQPEEVLVVNNDIASARDVGEVIARQYPHAILINNDVNLGQAGSKNVGIARASGDVISLLDDDDKWHPEFLASHAEMQAERLPDVVYSGYTAFWDDVPLAPKVIPAMPPPANLFEEMIRGRFTIGAGSVLSIRRATLDKVGGYDESLTGFIDWDLLCRIARDGVFTHIPQSLAFFRMHLGERDSSPVVRQSEFASILEKWRDTDGVDEMVARFTSDAHYNASRYSVFAGNRSDGIRHLWSYIQSADRGHVDLGALAKLWLLNLLGRRAYGSIQRFANPKTADSMGREIPSDR